MKLVDLEKAKQELEQWEKEHYLLIEEVESCSRINQPMQVRQDFMASPFYLMHKIKKLRCEVCHYVDKYKYIRTSSMFASSEASCLVFMLCESCYMRDNTYLPIPIDKGSYIPMCSFLANIESGLEKFRLEAQFSESIIRKYDFFENKLSNIIWQLIKAVQKKRSIVCKKIFNQISTLRQFYLDKKSSQIYDILLKQQLCQCQNQCCYCDYEGKNQEYLKVNCEYFNLKKQQNEVIQKIYLLSTICSNFDGVHDESIFNGITKEVEMVIIKQMESVEQSLNEIVKQTQDFSLLNTTFLSKIIDNYTSTGENLEESNEKILIMQSTDKYIEQGVLNHLTSDHFSQFSNAITSISLNFMPDELILRNKLKMLKQLNNIEVGCNEIGQLLVEDTIKSHQQHRLDMKIKPYVNSFLSHNGVLYDIQQEPNGKYLQGQYDEDPPLISLTNFKQLKNLSFNCNIPYNGQFFDSIDELNNMEQLHINWNFANSFQKFNESIHFREDRSIINSVAPSSVQFQNYCMKHPLKNIWIGNCGLPEFEESSQHVLSEEIKIYDTILEQMNNKLETVMFGQFDGRYRRLQYIFYQRLSKLSSIKALFFNKIELDPQLFQKMLKSNIEISILYLNECENVTEQIVDEICKLRNLKKLSIVQIKAVRFKKSVPTLQTFILQSCCNFGDSNIAVLLSECKLKALSLFQCRFFQDELLREILMQQINNKSDLNYLNLGYTRITNQTLYLINSFPQIKSLHIGGTALNLSQLLSEINRGKYTNLRTLQKLSMKDMTQIRSKFSSEEQICISQFYNDIFSNILEYFPLISHLDLSSNKGINERAIRFGLANLTYLTVTDTLYSLKRDNERIDHSGLECPFAGGRLNLAHIVDKRKDSSSKQQIKKIESSTKRFDGLKIIS